MNTASCNVVQGKLKQDKEIQLRLTKVVKERTDHLQSAKFQNTSGNLLTLLKEEIVRRSIVILDI